MDFGLTTAQLDMRAALADMLAAVCPPAQVRRAWQPEEHGDVLAGVINQLAGIGMLGVVAPAELGGLGGDEIDLAVVMEECGRFCVPGPLAEHVAVGVPALAAARHPEAARAAGGEVIVTALEPERGRAAYPDLADICVLVADSAVSLPGGWKPGAGMNVVDRSQRSGPVHVTASEALPGFDGGAAADRAALAVAAQLAGLARQVIDMAVGYVKVRHQFGQPVGAQQAVKHLLASALIALAHARPVVYRAAYAMARAEPDASCLASFAKVYAYRAAHTAARASLQCHGAIGYSWEHDLHLWIKRIWTLGPAWGTVARHEAAVADFILGPA